MSEKKLLECWFWSVLLYYIYCVIVVRCVSMVIRKKYTYMMIQDHPSAINPLFFSNCCHLKAQKKETVFHLSVNDSMIQYLFLFIELRHIFSAHAHAHTRTHVNMVPIPNYVNVFWVKSWVWWEKNLRCVCCGFLIQICLLSRGGNHNISLRVCVCAAQTTMR